ncbi:MAG: hypothetical protein II655_06725, partial [Thermoguttaceae bacterium]|nr:hypothetical protein [Thermoguttaceae bacterium]
AYESGVRSAQDAWRATYDALTSARDAAIESAWNEYSLKYSRASREYADVSATSWEDSPERAKIEAKYDKEIADLATTRATTTAALSAWYQSECDDLEDDYDSSVWSGHTSACSGSNHSDACQIAQIDAKEAYYKAKIQLSLDYLAKQLEASVAYDEGAEEAAARRDTALAEGERAFNAAKNARLATIARQAATYGLEYQTASANALYDFYAGAVAPGETERSGGLVDADATYRNAVATLAETATIQTWTAISAAVDAWSDDQETGATWGGLFESLYGLAATEDLADAAAYKAAVASDAAAQKTAELAAAGALRTYLTSEATAICAREQSSATHAETLQIAALNATKTATVANIDARLDALTEQLDSALATRLETFKLMREDGRATGAALAACDRSLVGVNDFNLRWQIESATRATLSALWKSNAQGRLRNELDVLDSLLDSASSYEEALLDAELAKGTAFWNALGTYWKSEIASETTLAIAKETASNAFQTTLVAAESALATAQVAIESSYDQALAGSSFTRESNEFNLVKNLWTTEYASYYSSLDAACQNLSDAALGAFYSSLVSAAQTDFNAQWNRDATYFAASSAK